MQISYDAKSDLLYLRLDDTKQDVINRRVTDDVVLDIGKGDRIVGIEILDASKHVRIEKILPVEYADSGQAGETMAVREKAGRAYRGKRSKPRED
jgi:uncharacterized protein YuzE